MKRFIGFIVAAIMVVSVPITANAWSIQSTSVAYFVQLNGEQVDSYGNVSSRPKSNYTAQVASSTLKYRLESGFSLGTGGDVTEDNIFEYISDPAEDSDVLAAVAEQKLNEGYLKDSSGNIVPWSKLTTDYYGIDWYVLKYENGDKLWHVDGRLVEKDTDTTVTIYTPEDKEDIPAEAYTPEYDNPLTLENDYAYIFGRTNTAMEPEDGMKRGEASAVLYRLLKQNGDLGGFSYDKSASAVYSDISGRWDRSAIEYMNYIGVYGDDTDNIRPDEYITRGEAFKMMAMALGFTDDTTLQTEQYAAILVSAGYVDGYGDGDDITIGDLKLGNDITRAEFCKIYNLIIDRDETELETADGETVTAETYGFVDLDEDEWYTEDILKATSAFEDGKVSLEKRGVRNNLDDYE